jgi:hypothetical protein
MHPGKQQRSVIWESTTDGALMDKCDYQKGLFSAPDAEKSRPSPCDLQLRYWRRCSGFRRRIDSQVDTSVSEMHTISVFSAEDGDSSFYETLVCIRWFTWCYNRKKKHCYMVILTTVRTSNRTTVLLLTQMCLLEAVMCIRRRIYRSLQNNLKCCPINNFSWLLGVYWSRVSSGSIVSDYGLDDPAIGVRSPAGAKDFSSILCIQTGSGAHPASCTIGTGGPFPGGESAAGAWRWPLTPI